MESIKVYHGEKAPVHEDASYRLFLSAWNALNDSFSASCASLSTGLYKRLESFIQMSYTSWLDEVVNVDAQGSTASVRHIPTALILTGVNTPDHPLIYRRVKSSVLRIGGRVANVPPGANTTSVRLLLSEVVNQITSGDDGMTWLYPCGDAADDEDIGGGAVPPSGDNFKSDTQFISVNHLTPAVRSTYAALVDWYYGQGATSSIEKKQPEENKITHSIRPARRSLSQPTDVQPRRVLRSSLFTTPGRPAATVRQSRARRFTELTRPAGTSGLPDSPSLASPSRVPASKHSTSLGRGGPLVIVLPQVEAVAGHVLDAFIQLTGAYSARQQGARNRSLPFCLVFGLSTPPEAGGFESRLNAHTLSRLGVQRFTVPPPAVYLDAILTELIHFPGFHLTSSTLNHLVDSLFLCLDYTVVNFVNRVKFCMLEHYLNTPHPALLVSSWSSERVRDYLFSLPASRLAETVSLNYPSLASLALTTATAMGDGSELSSALPRLSTGERSLVDRLVGQLCTHWQVMYRAPRVLNWFLALISVLLSGTSPLGKSLTELYRHWLQHGIADTDEFKVTVQLLRGVTSRDIWSSALRQASSRLTSADPRDQDRSALWSDEILASGEKRLQTLARDTDAWVARLQGQLEVDKDVDVDEDSAASMTPPVFAMPSNGTPAISKKTTSSQSATPGRKVSMRGLRQHIQELAAASPARFSPLPRNPNKQTRASERDSQLTDLLSWLRSQLAELLPQLSSLPMHEVLYGPVGDQNLHPGMSIRRRLNPPLQRCLHQALMDPGAYLRVPDYALPSPDSLSPSLPDLCILYKLHCESASRINLYDWLVAFATVLGENVDKHHPPSQLIQARFLHGLAELHHLGYVKSSSRKTIDYVTRISHGLIA